VNNYIDVFRALSDITRIRILHLLLKAKDELCICEIMDSLQLAQYNISKHIRELKIAGLVKERKEGRFVFYSIVKQKDEFYQNVIKSVQLINNSILKCDKYRLKKRLKLRRNNKPILCNGKCKKELRNPL